MPLPDATINDVLGIIASLDGGYNGEFALGRRIGIENKTENSLEYTLTEYGFPDDMSPEAPLSVNRFLVTVVAMNEEND